MLETSKDLLLIALAFCAVLFTGFICLLLYQFVAVFRDVRKITKGLKEKIQLIDEILKNIKDKVQSTANYVGIVFNGVEKVVEYIHKKNTKRSADQSPPKKKPRTKKFTSQNINQPEL